MWSKNLGVIYMIDYDRCKNGLPHDMANLADFANAQYKQCVKCGKKHKFAKDSKGRVDNLEYLRICISDTAQPTGRTKSVYMKVYHPTYNVSRICLNDTCNKKQLCIHRLGIREELRINNKIKKDGMNIWDA